MSLKNQVIVMDALHDNFIAKDQVNTPELKKVTNLSDDQLNEAVGILYSDGYVNFNSNKSFNLTLLTRQHFYKCRSEIKDKIADKEAIKAKKTANIFKKISGVLVIGFGLIQSYTSLNNNRLEKENDKLNATINSNKEVINKLQNTIDSLSSELLIAPDSLATE